jgi:anti-sigma factor RsiW
MDCQTAQEEILDSYEAGVRGLGPLIEAHLLGCPDCARFAARQQAVDARLAKALVTPAMSPSVRADLRRTIRRETRSSWSDRLPDIVHFASCGVATLCCAFLLPFDAATTVGAGTTAALLTYILLTTVRNSFEDIEQREL